ncbi:MAG: hypothetical protein ABR987_06655 [Terracidiphilus sp.]
MNRRFSFLSRCLLIAVTVGLLFTATYSTAQAGATVRIPFAFTANHQIVPAGYYKVELLSDRFLAFVDAKTGKTQTIVMVRPESGSAIETRSRLVFMTSGGNRYYLREVKVAGTSVHSNLIMQYKFEADIAKNESPAASTFEVAME